MRSKNRKFQMSDVCAGRITWRNGKRSDLKVRRPSSKAQAYVHEQINLFFPWLSHL